HARRLIRGFGFIERRSRESEGGGRVTHSRAVVSGLAQHLVLHLHQIPGVEELRGGELRGPHRFGLGVQRPGGPQRLLLRILSPPDHRTPPASYTNVSSIMPTDRPVSRTTIALSFISRPFVAATQGKVGWRMA